MRVAKTRSADIKVTKVVGILQLCYTQGVEQFCCAEQHFLCRCVVVHIWLFFLKTIYYYTTMNKMLVFAQLIIRQ